MGSYTLESDIIVFIWLSLMSGRSFLSVTFTISDFLPSSCPFDLLGPQYRLEKQSEPNVAVDLESTLESQNAWEFCLVRENSTLTASLCAASSVANILRSDVVDHTFWPGVPKQIKSDHSSH